MELFNVRYVLPEIYIDKFYLDHKSKYSTCVAMYYKCQCTDNYGSVVTESHKITLPNVSMDRQTFSRMFSFYHPPDFSTLEVTYEPFC